MLKYLIGVCDPVGCTLVYVEPKDMGWFLPFTTRTKGDGIHSRVMWKQNKVNDWCRGERSC